MIPVRATSDDNLVKKATIWKAKSRSSSLAWATRQKANGVCALPPRIERPAWKPACGETSFSPEFVAQGTQCTGANIAYPGKNLAKQAD